MPPDAPWIGMHADDYRESLEPPERDWDAENDCDRDEGREGEEDNTITSQ